MAAVTGVGVVLVGRNDGPAFHDAEVHRLDRLMKTIESVLVGIHSAAGLGLSSIARTEGRAHRRLPAAAPGGRDHWCSTAP